MEAYLAELLVAVTEPLELLSERLDAMEKADTEEDAQEVVTSSSKDPPGEGIDRAGQ